MALGLRLGLGLSQPPPPSLREVEMVSESLLNFRELLDTASDISSALDSALGYIHETIGIELQLFDNVRQILEMISHLSS